MRCPKCQYISFDNGERCRNCGYEFSLVAEARGLDLPIQTGNEPVGPLADLALDTRSGNARPDAAKAADAVVSAPKPITSSFDLPLFKERRFSDEPSRTIPSVPPRLPLSVRRSTPTPPPRRANRPEVDEPVLDLGIVDSPPAPPSPPAMWSAIREPVHPSPETRAETAPVGVRLVAAIVDNVLLLTIGLIVLYLTLKICELPVSRLNAIPPIPFIAFLLLIAGGYFTLFTAAGGQTIGKMAAGIRVVPMNEDSARVPLGQSVLRAVAYGMSMLPAGLGLVPALTGADRRTFHDRLADTRVVKA
jgi:uncharacterized RDD family membrane protein YckC